MNGLLRMSKRFTLFAGFGLVAFLVSEAIIALGYAAFGRHLIVGVEVFAAFASVTVGFILNEKVTMRGVGVHGGGVVGLLSRLAKYQMVYALGNAISIALQLLLLYAFGVSPSLGNILGSAVALPVNYLMSSRVVWGVRALAGMGRRNEKAWWGSVGGEVEDLVVRRVWKLSEVRLLMGLVCLGVVLRWLVFSSTPRFQAVGDAAQYVALAKEIILNHYAIPSQNTLYYPGTPWIYPPLGLELFAITLGVVGSSGWTPFYVLAALMVAFDSLTVIPVYLTAKTVFDEETALAAGLLFAAYPPGLYALSWSAYPQTAATLLAAWALWLWARSEKGGGVWGAFVMGLLVGLAALVHDLTAFVLVCVLSAYSVLGFLWAVLRRKGFSAATKSAWLALAASSPFVAYWYAPRIQWVFYAASATSQPQTLLSAAQQFLGGFAIPMGVYYGYTMFYAVFLAFSAFRLARDYKPSMLPLAAFGLVPLAIMGYEHSHVILLERLPYYTLFSATLFASRGLVLASRGVSGLASRLSARPSRLFGLALIAFFAAFTAFSAVSYSASAHTYYARCDYCGGAGQTLTELALYDWILRNTPPGSVFAAAGHVGYYIAAYDGRPTLVYHSLDYLTQPYERYESLAAYTLVFEPAKNTAATLTYILEFNVSYVVVYDLHNVSVPYFYEPVYSDGPFTVYLVSLGRAGQA